MIEFPQAVNRRGGHRGTRVRRSLPTARSRTAGRLLYAVVLLSALTLPASYRSGTDVPHPHAIYQLWIDASDGSTDHHHRGASPETLRAKPRPRLTIGSSLLDVPRLTDVTAAHERPLIVPALAVLGLFLLLTRSDRAWGIVVSLAGRRPRPDVPPPRFAVSS